MIAFDYDDLPLVKVQGQRSRCWSLPWNIVKTFHVGKCKAMYFRKISLPVALQPYKKLTKYKSNEQHFYGTSAIDCWYDLQVWVPL